MRLLVLLLLVSSCSLSGADIERDLEANIIGDLEEEGNFPENLDRRECDFEKDASDLYIKTVSVTLASVLNLLMPMQIGSSIRYVKRTSLVFLCFK